MIDNITKKADLKRFGATFVTKKTILITASLLFMPMLIFPGTPFEKGKKTSDPFIGERGGFNSLFVNPAGVSGQSGFGLSVTTGMNFTTNDANLMKGIGNIIYEKSQEGEFEIGSINKLGTLLIDLHKSGAVNYALLDSLFDATALDPGTIDWSDPVAVKAANESLSPGEITIIQNNLEGVLDGSNAAFYAALPDKVSTQSLAGLKTGFLIKGFGLGIYNQTTAVGSMNPGSQLFGLEAIDNELGVIVGGGFNIFDGKIALGITANYGLLMRNTSPVSFFNFNTLINGSINYGYNLGVDLGAIWRPTPSIGFGIVFKDVVGYTQTHTPYNAAGLADFLNRRAYLMNRFDYEFTMDIDAGVTWQPDWRFAKPKLSLDLYNLIGYGRAVGKNQDNLEGALYRSLEHIRIGANFTFFEFLKIGAQYYDHYLSTGFGLDLLPLEISFQFKIHNHAVRAATIGDIPIGGDMTVRIYF